MSIGAIGSAARRWTASVRIVIIGKVLLVYSNFLLET
jgi:hypothetical protein